MVHFSYCFLLTLLHSIWQAGILYLFFILFNAVLHKNNPAVKRNILFLLILSQVLISISTFIYCFSGNNSIYSDELISGIANYFISKPVFETMAPWIFTAYMIIFASRTTYMAFNWSRFYSVSRNSWKKPSVNLKLFTILKSHEFGIRRKVSIWLSDHISTPMTYGFFKPVILLPVALINNLSVKETETLIIHELTHIRNNDYLLNWLLLTCESLFFFNPFIRLLGNRIRLERELNCDSMVMQFDYEATGYAETLLKAAIFKKENAPFILTAVARHSQLFKRIHFFTKETNLLFNKRNYTGLLIAPVILLFMLNMLLQDSLNHKDDFTAKAKNIPSIKMKDGFANTFSSNPMPLAKTEKKPINKSSSGVVPNKKVLLANDNISNNTEIYDDDIPGIIAIPAAINDADDSKEIILKEESSATGKSVTKVYNMKFVNGEWKFELMLTITESKATPDSNNVINKDTSHQYNPVQ